MPATNVVTEIWDRATGTQPAPSLRVVAGTALLAMFLVVAPSAWRRTRHLVTIAHEAAHALAALASDHGSPEERYFNLICAAYGYDARLFSIEMNKIPPSRAQKCRDEYEDIKYAMQTVFWPHLDHDKVKRVLAMRWFIDINAKTSTSKAN